jgi:hypothetical protein
VGEELALDHAGVHGCDNGRLGRLVDKQGFGFFGLIGDGGADFLR